MTYKEVRVDKETECSLQLFPKYGSLMLSKKHTLPQSKMIKYGSCSVTLMSIYIHRISMLAQAVILLIYNQAVSSLNFKWDTNHPV